MTTDGCNYDDNDDDDNHNDNDDFLGYQLLCRAPQ